PRELPGARVRLRGGSLDRARGGRRRRPGERDHGRAVRALRVARGGRVRRPPAVRAARRVRRPRRAMTATATRVRDVADTAVRTPEDHVIVLFGASGDLARRKLLPGLFHLNEAGLMPRDFRIVGCSRNAITDEEFRQLARDAVNEFGRRPATDESWGRFAA